MTESQETFLRRISQASIPLEQAYEAAGGGSLGEYLPVPFQMGLTLDPPLRLYLYKILYRM